MPFCLNKSDAMKNAKTTLAVCGTVVGMAAACENHGYVPLPEEDLQTLEKIRVEMGEEEILPLIDYLVSLADDDKILGPGKNEFGHEAFSAGMWQANDRLQEMIANGQVNYFADPNYPYRMYYHDVGSFQDKEFMAINKAMVEVLDPDIAETDSAYWGIDYVPFSLLIHEASHDQTPDHTKKVKKACETYHSKAAKGFSSVVFDQAHDYTIFLDGVVEEGELNLYSVKYLQEKFARSLEVYETSEHPSVQNIFNGYEHQYARYKTPVEFATAMAERSPLLTQYLEIPLHEVRNGYILETSWHEKYIEGFLTEYENFREANWEAYQEWKEREEAYQEQQQETDEVSAGEDLSEAQQELQLPQESSMWGRMR